MSACITLFNSIVATYRNKNVTLLMSKNIEYIEVYKMYHSNIPINITIMTKHWKADIISMLCIIGIENTI